MTNSTPATTMRTLSRRELLRRSGWTAGGLTVLAGCSWVPVLPTFTAPRMTDGLAWVQMRRDGRVRFLCPRAEMGQGASTGLAQVVAEELLVPLDRVDCVYPTTADIAPTQMTVGSQSIENFFEPTARAAAALREALLARAAARSRQPSADLIAVVGGFTLPGGEHVSHGDLLDGGENTLLEPDPQLLSAPLLSKQPRTRVVGASPTPLHTRSIVTGTETFSRDVRVPGMAFGSVARPPYLGAEPQGHDRAAALAVPGAIAVVEGPDRELGVVAESPVATRRMLHALAPRWQPLTDNTRARFEAGNDVDEAIAENRLVHTPVNEGSVPAGVGLAERSLDVRYDTPMTAHAAMEPRAGVAEVRDGRCVVFTASQDPWYVQGAVARAIGMARKRVVVHNHRIGGAFGGRLHCQASVEAAWLSQRAGRPVKVQWSREEEFLFNYVGPQFSHRIQAGVTASGDIAFWHHRMVGSPILTTSALIPSRLHWVADRLADPGTWRGADMPYRAPHRRVDFASVRRPMPTGAWRGLGAAPNTFAVECAMDELADLAAADPLQFRARQAANPRLAQVLSRLSQICRWQRRPGLGVAAAAYKGVTFVAVAAEVERVSGRPQVRQLWCVHDCGRVINPDLVRAQIEGNLVWGVGMALTESFSIKDGIAATANFDTYRLPRQRDVPPLHVELMESAVDSSGAGEAAFAPAAAAIVNAFASLDGARTRTLPLT